MKVTDLELMLFHDGELDPERARVVRVARLCEIEVSGRLGGLERVGELVRAAARERALGGDSVLRDASRARFRRRSSVFVSVAVAAGALFGLPEPRLTPEPAPTVEIEAVDFGSRAGTVFVLEAEGERHTAVVWLADDVEQAKLGTL